MSYLFEIKDKTGRKIRLSRKQWSHITSPSSPHAYMTNYLEEIKETLAKPDKVFSGIYDKNVVNYYKYYKKDGAYLRIVVKYLNGEGFVITSYFVRNIKR